MIYSIPESLQDSHDGEEWAIATILGGRVVALRYLADVAPDLELIEPAIKEWLASNPIELRELQALGPVSVGVVGVQGFDQRWRLTEWRLRGKSS
ncbi:hypothetical protein [Bordetella genomosp. 4]|uniref:Uncharacterized protein n=1 Tax=Bordetella genomosp. 4 TaxID=463044 RepID=A0A261U6X7_9BORD|nr:hypothetical protein [Bordetella genomosp. 4]OZI57684.1 hypothetical protein CAL20_09935 [Bordetella genomosp. 4]